LIVLATADIRTALDAGYETRIIAENGQRIDEMLPPLREALGRDGSVAAVFVNLGTNNVIQHETYAGALDDLDHLIETVADVPCVVLTTISTFLDTSFGSALAGRLNAKIRALREQDSGKYQIVDWDAAIHAPGGVEELMMVDGVTDGVHENPTAGREWFADEYVEALSRCPRLNRP